MLPISSRLQRMNWIRSRSSYGEKGQTHEACKRDKCRHEHSVDLRIYTTYGYTYCLLLFCPPLPHITSCYYNRFPTSIQHRYANARRRKDGHYVGTAARGLIERLSR